MFTKNSICAPRAKKNYLSVKCVSGKIFLIADVFKGNPMYVGCYLKKLRSTVIADELETAQSSLTQTLISCLAKCANEEKRRSTRDIFLLGRLG